MQSKERWSRKKAEHITCRCESPTGLRPEAPGAQLHSTSGWVEVGEEAQMLADMESSSCHYQRNWVSNQTVQRTGASRFAQRQIQRHRRLAPVADLCVRLARELARGNFFIYKVATGHHNEANAVRIFLSTEVAW